MGLSFSRLWSLLFGAPKKIVLVGLDNAGKTSVLYRINLHGGDVQDVGEDPIGGNGSDAAASTSIETTPTIGANVERVRVGNVELECWDIGGQSSLRSTWGSYFGSMSAIVLVVDACDHGRIGTTKDALFTILAHDELQRDGGCRLLLVLANKQDRVDEAMSPEQLSDALHLHTIKGAYIEWHIQGTSARTGQGIAEGFDWLAAKIGEGKVRRVTQASPTSPTSTSTLPKPVSVPVSAAAGTVSDDNGTTEA